jgi:hypothetical protein
LKSLFHYIFQYFRALNKRAFTLITVFIAVLVFLNYQFGIEKWIVSRTGFPQRLFFHYLVYFLAFCFPYLMLKWSGKKDHWNEKGFLFLLFLAPLVFAFKHSFAFPFEPTGAQWQQYWRHILYWPVLVVLTALILYGIWKFYRYPAGNFYGLKLKGINLKPYLIMLSFMVPLIALASTQSDFLEMYPKMKIITGDDANWISPVHKLLFELAYGTDFITIELFFRGFLVLAFIQWVGRDAILPMACFYCTIHFGKPLPECISSYFGGMLLGIVVYHTRSILGGLIVHLGIAWLMELGGWLGFLWRD